LRLFKDEPKWTPLNRGEETERNPIRREYVAARERGFVGQEAVV
jgi:cupin superfamily acireductone dioxygenase involved in methionine salvage